MSGQDQREAGQAIEVFELPLVSLVIDLENQFTLYRVPTPQGKQGKQGKLPKRILSGKTQGIWKFCQNTGKTQGIWFAQVVNSLILKVKNISVFAAKISIS